MKAFGTDNTDVPRRSTRAICTIGAGYVGATTSVVIAWKNPLVTVTVADSDAKRIAAWNSEQLPILEPGLEQILAIINHGVAAECPRPASDSQGTIRNGAVEGDSAQRKERLQEKSEDRQDRGSNNIRFTTNIRKAIDEADLIFIAVNTPPKACSAVRQQYATRGNLSHTASPAGSEFHQPKSDRNDVSLDLSCVQAAVKEIAEVSTTPKTVVVKSTVPCGTAEGIDAYLRAHARPGASFVVLSNPEVLSQGTAITDILYPDCVVIGTKVPEQPSDVAGRKSLAKLYERWIPLRCTVRMSYRSAELFKLANNAMMAQRISSINALSVICEAVGADVRKVSRACGMSSRIGPHCLEAGIGFGGSCLGKDTGALVSLADGLGLHEVAEYWRHVLLLNSCQITRCVSRVFDRFPNGLDGQRVSVLGFAFKEGTDDSRGSVAREVVVAIWARGAVVAIHDQHISAPNLRRDVDDMGAMFADDKNGAARIIPCQSAYEACDGAAAIILMNDEMEYRQMNWDLVAKNTKKPKYVFDSRSCLDSKKLENLGLVIDKVGSSSDNGDSRLPVAFGAPRGNLDVVV